MVEFNPDWVPSLHLGHNKLNNSADKLEKQQERAQRLTERRKREREREEQEAVKVKIPKEGESGRGGGGGDGERIRDIHFELEEEEYLAATVDEEEN